MPAILTNKPESVTSIWKPAIQKAGLAIAKFAGFEAGQPSITKTQYTRYNSNPNTVGSQLERVAMIWSAEHLVKDVPIGIGYCGTRRVYSSPTGWLPNTGDSVLDREVKEFLSEEFETLGVNCSLWTLFEQATAGDLPLGDACLIFARDSVGNLKLMEAGPDQIGEYYNFAPPSSLPQQGLTYFAGMYFDENGNRAGYKIYERGYNQVYTNARFYPASDVIYLQDNMRPAVRGFTIFHGAIIALEKSYKLFQYGMDAAQKQAKVAVVASNNLGAPIDNMSYLQSREGLDGNVFYIDRNFEGAQTQYQYNGDSFDYMQTQSPGPELIEGCRYSDEQACLSLNMPYSMLVNMRDVGGAPSRLEIERASKEISRLCRLNESPFKRIVYTVLMDAVNKGIFSGNALKYALTRGQVLFPTLPSADSNKDSKSDINEIRAGLTSPQMVMGNYRINPDEVVRQKKDWAVMTSMAVEDANRELVAAGYKPTVTIASVSQDTDNPQTAAIAEVVDQTGNMPQKTTPPVQTAKLSAFIGDVLVSTLPTSTQSDISKILGADASGLTVSRFNMTADELAHKADSHNLESAQRNIRYCSNGSCAEEVHANDEKMILVQNDKMVDGHHFLAKALKAKITKSLPVVDLSPLRFQK